MLEFSKRSFVNFTWPEVAASVHNVSMQRTQGIANLNADKNLKSKTKKKKKENRHVQFSNKLPHVLA